MNLCGIKGLLLGSNPEKASALKEHLSPDSFHRLQLLSIFESSLFCSPCYDRVSSGSVEPCDSSKQVGGAGVQVDSNKADTLDNHLVQGGL